MAWDSNRPVPWTRLMREWVIYALIMSIVFALFFSEGGLIGVLAGLLISGPLYLGLGAILAKMGYKRRTIKEMRNQRHQPPAESSSAAADAQRPRPAPTRRTSTGRSNRPPPRRRR